jgi:hypothetical protein
MSETQIPAVLVASGYGVPEVCSRHGEVALDRRRTRFISRPPQWSYVLVLAGLVVWLVVVVALRKTVVAAAWPFCARCRALRTRLLTIGLATVAVGIVAVVGSIALTASDPSGHSAAAQAGPFGLLVGLVVLLVGAAVAGRGGTPAIANAFVSGDGRWLGVRKAHPAFAERVRALVAAAPPPTPYPPAYGYAPQFAGFGGAPGYQPQPGYPAQAGYPGYPPQPGYQPQPGYPAQAGYPGYPPQHGYPAPPAPTQPVTRPVSPQPYDGGQQAYPYRHG